MSASLCLGTAQFGMEYGITNTNGELNQNEINKLINIAYKSDIKYLDTAQDYGDSEKKLGTSNYMNKFRIINKFSTIYKYWDQTTVNKWEIGFQESLKNMKVDKFDSFLVHNCEYFNRNDVEILINWLVGLRERNLIKRLGVSIYDVEDINNLPLEYIDVIQLPLSIYDQRFLSSGSIKYLAALGKSIFARSIFLQGLVLQNPFYWPSFISDSFKNHHHEIINQLKSNNQTIIECALRFIYDCKGIEGVLFGITEEQELRQILEIWESFKSKSSFLKENKINLPWHKKKDIDPRLWHT